MGDDPIVECGHCGAKLKVKAATLKVMKSIRCGKCQNKIDLEKSVVREAAVSEARSEARVESPVAEASTAEPQASTSPPRAAMDAAPAASHEPAARVKLSNIGSKNRQPESSDRDPHASSSDDASLAQRVDRLEARVREQQQIIEELSGQVQKLVHLNIESSTSVLTTFSSRD